MDLEKENINLQKSSDSDIRACLRIENHSCNLIPYL